MENMIYVKSNSNCTIGINVPELHLKRTWTKRGQKYPFDRTVLEQAYYEPSVEYLFRHGMLITDDKQFKIDIGLISEDAEEDFIELTEAIMKRMIKLMPLTEVRDMLSKMSPEQCDDLANFAILNYKDLNLDRIELFNKAAGRDLLRAIENYKASQEG